jgi:acetyl-CoA synthetase
VPELDDGADDPLLNPEPEVLELDDPELEPDPELVPDEPVPDEPVPDEPVPDEPELTLVDPELSVPEEDPADDEPDEVEPAEDVVLCEPGRARAMAPAVTTLASPTVAVAVWTRLCPRARDAMARRTLSRFGVFIPGSLLPASGNGLCTGSQPPMSLDGTGRTRGANRPSSGITRTVVNWLPASGRPRPQELYVRTVRRGLARAGPRAAAWPAHNPQPPAPSAWPAARGPRPGRPIRQRSRWSRVTDAGFTATMAGMTDSRSGAASFRAARDFLLRERDDYDAARAGFCWPELHEFNWALDWFDVIATEHPDRTALRIVTPPGPEADEAGRTGGAERGTRISYADMSARSSQVASWLRDVGVQRGDRLLLMLGNIAPLWETILAAMKLGAVIIPTSTLLGPPDLADRISRGQVRHVITESVHVPKFREVPGDWTRIAVAPTTGGGTAPAPAAPAQAAGPPSRGAWLAYEESWNASPHFTPDGPTPASNSLLLYFTSGTTAQPKLVQHTHASYPAGHLSTMYWIGLQPGDVHLNISSPGWAKHAWSNVYAPWNAGATAMIFGYDRFSPENLLQVLAEERVSTFCAPPTVWRMLIQADLSSGDVSALRECLGAGEPLNPEVIEQVRSAWGITVRDGYGQTETTAQIGNTPGQAVQLGSMGRPLPGYDVTLIDPASGNAGDEGEICLDLSHRPLGLMTGYLGDAAQEAEAMRDGYYHTGDVASRDADGYITYIGRTDDVFKASDYRISPFELESVLIEHEAVAEAAVVPSPDAVRLSVPKAYVSLAPGLAPSAEVARSILAYGRSRLAPYKRIRRIEFADLPKTISGKIRRVELRSQEDQRAGNGDAPFRDPDGIGGPFRPEPSPRGTTEFWEEDFSW